MNSKKTVTVATYITTSSRTGKAGLTEAKKTTKRYALAPEPRKRDAVSKPRLPAAIKMAIDPDTLEMILRRSEKEGMSPHFTLDELIHFALKNCPPFFN